MKSLSKLVSNTLNFFKWFWVGITDYSVGQGSATRSVEQVDRAEVTPQEPTTSLDMLIESLRTSLRLVASKASEGDLDLGPPVLNISVVADQEMRDFFRAMPTPFIVKIHEVPRELYSISQDPIYRALVGDSVPEVK